MLFYLILHRSDFLYADSYCLTIDIPFFIHRKALTGNKLVRQHFLCDNIAVIHYDTFYPVVAAYGNADVVHHFKAGVLTHCLDLADNLINEAFLNKLICQIGDRKSVV